jgi:signal transduction histidine kinase
MLSAQGRSLSAYRPPYADSSWDEVSRHKCLIYNGEPSEQLPVVIPFLLDGLKNNWRCLYVGSPDVAQIVEQALVAHGVNTLREAGRGALVISSDRSHLITGAFDPKLMVDWLSKSVDDAVNAGFEGLCATGDMRWELGEDENFEHLLEYEARLEQLFRAKPLRGICQYHRNIVPPHAIRNALVTHRSAYLGAALKPDNFYYIPPDLLLETHSGGVKVGEWMCEQIIRVLNAESARDKAMTALKESEAQQKRLAEKLAEMNRDLERRVQERTSQLQQTNRELEAFSYSVSHDLRSPLHHINGFATLLAEDCDATLDDKDREYLGRIQAGTKQMAGLIEDLLRLAKLSQTELRVGKVQLSVIAGNVVSALRFHDPQRHVEVKIEQNIEVQGDPGLLRAAIENLLSNAWKYTAKVENPVIEFGAISGPSCTTYFVRDNGAGFDMKYADRLFAPFQRMHRDEEFAGHGIGLATVQKIIHRHGGRVWAEATAGHGATFYFTLASSIEDHAMRHAATEASSTKSAHP